MSRVCINIAWPYSNGAIHLGHLAGSLLPPDIFSRYNRLLGNEVLMVGGSDQHGTPITVSAEKCGMTPEAYADKFHEINKKAIEDMGIEYSLFNKTHCAVHTEVVQDIFLKLKDKGLIYTKQTDQYFCPKCNRFLPDRYVEGVCPICGNQKTRSDQCDACGTTFEPGDLKEPYCTLCGATPEIRPTEHFFLKLSAFREELIALMDSKDHWRANVKAFTKNWLEDGLHDRAITRDMAWGVPIPMDGWDDKVIYVWFEAVIGYLSSSVEYSRSIGKPDYWELFWKDPECRHYYFIGKDNIPFHSIIWPAILMGIGDMTLPYDIPANEYLMIGGGKFSKSRGGAIDVPSVLEQYDADVVRYYLSAIMPDTHDSEFSWADFQTKVNNELVANLGNYYHRCLSFTAKNFGSIPAGADDEEVTKAIADALAEYNACLGACDFKKGIKVVMDLGHFGNRYFDSKKPWALVKEDKDACGAVMYNNLRLVKALCVMAWPFMPKSSERIWGFLGCEGTLEQAGIGAVETPLDAGQALGDSVPVYKKVEIKMEEEQKQEVKETKKEKQQPKAAVPEGPFAAFRRMDVRVGEVIQVDDHPEAEKLYVLKVDLGEEEPRQIVTNLKTVYPVDQMLGRKLLVISNLKPAKFRGVRSEGMLMALDDEPLGGSAILLLKPATDVPNGTRINCGLENSSSRIEVKHCEAVTIKVAHLADGKFMGRDIELPEGAPDIVAAIIDGDDIIVFGDGNGCVMTVESPDFIDGADVV
ncbi:MAG: methionine--tRNA ligase [Candidatus Methanomethylophilaceae archaeon]|nr:methionine--tRNA ligase [Candidatus Methanomethylophilaceae archaeon]